MSEWKKMLESYAQILEKSEREDGELRFGRSAATPSTIAQQYYCEKKVELAYLFGEAETEAERLGTESHEALLEGSEKVQVEVLWRKIFSDEPVAALEWLIAAQYKGVNLVGKPDCVIFRNGLPLVILEYKFSRRPIAFRGHHVQARIYGLLLNRMGFDTAKTRYAVVIVTPGLDNIDAIKSEVMKRVLSEPAGGVLRLEGARAYVNRLDLWEAERDLDWALGFWLKKREAVPTQNPNKCRSCEYAAKCEVASSSPSVA